MEWKQIKQSKYEISDTGLIRRYWSDRGYKYIKPQLHKKGYLRVNTPYSEYVHRLVSEAFLPIIEGKTHVNHIDGNKQNNHKWNLEWCTIEENNLHSQQTGLSNSQIPCVAVNMSYEIIKEFTGSKDARKNGCEKLIGKRVILAKEGLTFDKIKLSVDKLKYPVIKEYVRTKVLVNRRLTIEQVKEIKSLAEGKTMLKKDIATLFNVDRSQLSKILQGKCYKDVS